MIMLIQCCRFMAKFEGNEMDEIPPLLQNGEKEHVWIFQDESSFHTNDSQNVNYWLKSGEQVLKKKDWGRLMMVSGYICEKYGNVALTDKMVEENAKLPEQEQLAVTDSRVIIYPSSKPGNNAYWNSEQMVVQVINFS
jgi:hypothetical protein